MPLNTKGSQGRQFGRPRTTAGDAKPVSLYLDEATKDIIDARAPRGGRSEALRRIVGRYDNLVRASLPELPIETWRYVANAFAGPATEAGIPPRRALVNTVGHALAETLDEEVLNAAMAPLRALTEGEAAAVIDWNDRYWSGDREAQDKLIG
ncbi:hypothetical protein GAY28_00310 [Azospirillum brasilense]|nr:hypothetical protein [Azospirillum brasilense]